MTTYRKNVKCVPYENHFMSPVFRFVDLLIQVMFVFMGKDSPSEGSFLIRGVDHMDHLRQDSDMMGFVSATPTRL